MKSIAAETSSLAAVAKAVGAVDLGGSGARCSSGARRIGGTRRADGCKTFCCQNLCGGWEERFVLDAEKAEHCRRPLEALLDLCGGEAQHGQPYDAEGPELLAEKHQAGHVQGVDRLPRVTHEQRQLDLLANEAKWLPPAGLARRSSQHLGQISLNEVNAYLGCHNRLGWARVLLGINTGGDGEANSSIIGKSTSLEAGVCSCCSCAMISIDF